MSYITDQIELLKELANDSEIDCYSVSELNKVCKDAAYTIEQLSAKVMAANMEKSTAYYNGGWIPCDERLPDDDTKVLCQTITKKGIINFVIGYHADDRWCCGMNSNVVAWLPLPEPYKPEEKINVEN